jgi:hypothetical protein
VAAGALGPAFPPAAGLPLLLQLSSANALGLECWCMCAVVSRVIKVCRAAAWKLLLHIHTMRMMADPMPCLLLCLLPCLWFLSGAAQAGAGSGAGSATAAGAVVSNALHTFSCFPAEVACSTVTCHPCPGVLLVGSVNFKGLQHSAGSLNVCCALSRHHCVLAECVQRLRQCISAEGILGPQKTT